MTRTRAAFRLGAAVLCIAAAACSNGGSDSDAPDSAASTGGRPRATTTTRPDDLNSVRDVAAQLGPVEDARIETGRHRVVVTDDALQKRGGAWSREKLDLRRDFTLRFSAYFGDRDDGGDGLVFVLTAKRALGDYGCQLGITTTNSVAIEFDTYANAVNRPCEEIQDPEADHMALIEDGRVGHAGGRRVVELPNLEDGREHDLVVRWDVATKTLSATIAGATLTEQYDLGAKFGNDAFFGIVGGTGLASNLQYVR